MERIDLPIRPYTGEERIWRRHLARMVTRYRDAGWHDARLERDRWTLILTGMFSVRLLASMVEQARRQGDYERMVDADPMWGKR